MPNLNLRSFSQLVSNGTAAVQAACNQLLDFTPGSVIRSFIEAVAAVGLWTQELTFQVLLSNRLATAIGTDCDTFAADFGYVDPTRLSGGGPSSGVVTFSRNTTTAQVIIPVLQPDLITPTTIKSFDGSLTFQVGFDATNQSYNQTVNSGTGGYVLLAGVASINVPVVCQTSGIASNVQPNTLTLISSNIPGIDSVTNALAFTSGQAATTDAVFRSHFVNWVNSRSLGTLLAVQSAIENTQGVTSSTVLENTDANLNTVMGMFVVTVDDGSGAPSATLISAVQSAVEAVRPLGSAYVIRPPSVITVNIVATLTAQTGFQKAVMIAPVQVAVSTYISSLGVGGTLAYSKLIQVIWDATVGLANVTNVRINGLTADVAVNALQIIEYGTIVIN